jgi:hypothetical protein
VPLFVEELTKMVLESKMLRLANGHYELNWPLQSLTIPVTLPAAFEAIGHLTKGLELLKLLPETIERIKQELELQTLLGPVLVATKGNAAPEVEGVYARARELCQKLGETPELFPVLFGLPVGAFGAGRGPDRSRVGGAAPQFGRERSGLRLDRSLHLAVILGCESRPAARPLGRYSELTGGSLSSHDGVRRRSFPCQSSIKARATRCEVYGDLER